MKFEVSYLKADLESKDINTEILSIVSEAGSQIHCGQYCLGKRGCVTAIYKIIGGKCILLKENLKSFARYNPTTSQDQNTKTVLLRAVDPCFLNPCLNERKCANVESGFICTCQHDERGQLCEIKLSGSSCFDIKNKFSNFNPENGKYVISSAKESFLAYCDMEFDEGGWTQVASVVSNTTEKRSMSFQHISSLGNFNLNDNYVMTSEALQKFRSFSDFKQIRFQCYSKITNRTIHIKTKPSESSVVGYIVGVIDVRPAPCGTFTRYQDDDSFLSRNCENWAQSAWGFGDANKSLRLIDHTFFMWSQYHFLLDSNNHRFNCDNYLEGLSVGDFWSIYVR